ncbi:MULTISPECIES: hypothetical protein [unclassified Sphingomonas]
MIAALHACIDFEASVVVALAVAFHALFPSRFTRCRFLAEGT